MKIVRICIFAALISGCVSPAETECRHSFDCATGELCVVHECVASHELEDAPGLAEHSETSDEPGDLLAATDAGTQAPDTGTSRTRAVNFCTEADGPTPENIVLNELLPNPPPGLEGDANGDGERDAYHDEFVELVNVGDKPVDLTGVRIYSGERMRFKFEPICLKSGDSVVVFGGGYPALDPTVNVIASETRLSLANEGGVVRVIGPSGLLAEARYGPAPPASLTLSPQLEGHRYVDHRTISGGRVYSPGQCPDGSATTSGCPPPVESPDAGTD